MGEAKSAKVDAIRVGARLDAYVLEAVLHFRKSLTIDQRRQLFAGHKPGAGRPVKA
jgi:hypothetical protein